MSILGTIARSVDLCMTRLSYTQNVDLGLVAGTVVTKAGTITGTAGVGSSLFMERLRIPTMMSISEIQAAMSIAFPASNQGAGTMSRSFALFSFGNATSLATLVSASGTSSWGTGTVTAGASTSLTQFQGGWSSPLIQPMTFATSTVAPGEYVVGQIFDFAQASSTWTIGFYGQNVATSVLASAATNLASTTLAALSAGGLVTGSLLTGISHYGSPIVWMGGGGASANSAATVAQRMSASTASSSTQASGLGFSFAVSNSAASAFFAQSALTSNTYLISNLGTAVTGSLLASSTAVNAVTNVALGALNSTTLAQLTLPNFGFIGTGSTTSGFPTNFQNGIMSTGAIPAAITLTSAAVTFSGSVAFAQPWFGIAGS